MPDTNVEIGIKTRGAEGASQTVTKVSGAVTQANKRTTQAMQKAAQAQQQAASAASGAVNQLQSSILTLVSFAAAMKFVMDGIKSAMADEAAFVQATGTMRSMGLETAETTKRLRDFGTEMQAAAAIADDKVFPAFTRVLTVVRDLEKAEYLTELAMKYATATTSDAVQVSEGLTAGLTGQVTLMDRFLKLQGMTITSTTTLTDRFDFMEQKIRDNAGAANTAEMRFKKFGMQIADIGEMIGGALLVALRRLEFVARSVVNVVTAVIDTFAATIASAIDRIQTLGTVIKIAFTKGPVAAFQYAIDATKTSYNDLKADIEKTWDGFTVSQSSALDTLRMKAAELTMERKRPAGLEDGGGSGEGGDGDGEAAALDRQAMVRLQYRTGDLQAAMDHQLSLREIEAFGGSDRAKVWEGEYQKKEAFNKRFSDAYAATSQKVQAITLGAVEAMSGAWGDYFANKEAYEAKGVSLAEVSGRAILAFVLNQLKAELAAQAAKFASLAVANLLAGNVLGAAGNAAAAAFLGGGALLAGLGAGAVAPSAPMEVFPITEPGGGMPGGGGRGGSGGGGGSGGANTITNSTVTLNYNPVLVVNGNVYGMGDLKALWVEWNREHSFLAGEGLNTGGRG